MSDAPRTPTLAEATRAWVTVAAHSFGGPAGQIAVMHRVVVEERRWVSEGRFLHALNYCMLLPGPEAQQLATYLGWLLHGYRGGLIAGGLFVLPGFLSILALSSLYATFADLPAVAAALLGVKAAVLSVVVEALLRIGRRTLTDGLARTLAVAAFVALFFFQVQFPVVVVVAGGLGALAARSWGFGAAPTGDGDGVIDTMLARGAVHTVPKPARDLGLALGVAALWLAPTAALWAVLGPDDTFTRVGAFFSRMAVVTFGGAYAVLAYVAQEAVQVQGWLSAEEMLDGLGLAETTPGPLIQVVQFVGFLATFRDAHGMHPLVAGLLGSVLTTWATFGPSFGFVLAGAPYVERLRAVKVLSGALRAITAAVVGVVLNLAVWLSVHVVFGTVHERPLGPVRLLVPEPASVDPVALVIAVAAAIALLGAKWGMLTVLGVSAGAGWLAWALLG